MLKKKAVYLFESSWNRKYTPRGICKMLRRYADVAGIEKAISPHKLRHFFLLWLKKQGIDDALIQPYSGHARMGKIKQMYQKFHRIFSFSLP
jgi:integrase/recombinase XerD